MIKANIDGYFGPSSIWFYNMDSEVAEILRLCRALSDDDLVQVKPF